MRLVAITRIKNDVDIVEAFVRHTLAVADHLLVMDHGSTDGTPDILYALKASGLPLDVVESLDFTQLQSSHMTSLMHEAANEYQADWVLPLDADEFLLAERESLLPEALRNQSERSEPLQLYWRTYVPDPSDNPTELNPALRLRHRLVAESYPWSKVIIPGRLARTPGIELTQGSHAVAKNGQLCEALPVRDAYLAHLPVRTVGQYASKVAIAYLRYHATPNREIGQGFHYERAFHLLKTNFASFSEEIYAAACNYAIHSEQKLLPETILDPLPYWGGALKFTRSYDDRQAAIFNVLAFAELLAQAHAETLSTESLESNQRFRNSIR